MWIRSGFLFLVLALTAGLGLYELDPDNESLASACDSSCDRDKDDIEVDEWDDDIIN